MRDVAFLVPARNEEFLNETIADLIAHCHSDYEIIVVLDGAPAVRPIPQHDRVSIIILPESIGQRAATNLAARISKARYICKVDAHCSFDDGFDTKMISAGEDLGHETTQVPALFNLHIFNWKCMGCGKETYQGPVPTGCSACMSHGITGGPFERVIYWDLNAGGYPGKPRRTEFWRFGEDLIFKYWPEFKKRPEATGDIVDVMTSLGACFFMRRDRYFELGGLDTGHGGWGQLAIEVALKSWLSGGRHVVNRSTYHSHGFRTQHGYGFPYALGQGAIDKSREYSREMWLSNGWKGQVSPLSWLIDKFMPIPGWSDEAVARVTEAGELFYKERQRVTQHIEDAVHHDGECVAVLVGESDSTESMGHSAITYAPMLPVEGQAIQALDVDSGGVDAETRAALCGPGVLQEGVCQKMVIGHHSDTHDGQNQRSTAESDKGDGDDRGPVRGSDVAVYRSGAGRDHAGDGAGSDAGDRPGSDPDTSHIPRSLASARTPSTSIIYYSDNRPDPFILEACRSQLKYAAGDIPIVSCTLKPVDLGLNVVLPLERGYLTMARQILIALELSTADVIYLAEHDIVYSPTSFTYVPENDTTFFYNQAVYKVDATTGQALFYYCDQLSGLCAYRSLLLEHFRARVDRIEKEGFSRRMSFEPGTRKLRHGGIDDRPHASWMSAQPNVDIRHKDCMTPSRFRKDQFRNQKYTAGWDLRDDVPGWGVTKGRFREWLTEVTTHA